MTVIPYEKDAAAGNPMPEGLSLSQQKAYILMRELHKQFREGIVTKEQATDEKLKIVVAYKQERDRELLIERTLYQFGEKVLDACEEYEKNTRLRRPMRCSQHCSAFPTTGTAEKILTLQQLRDKKPTSLEKSKNLRRKKHELLCNWKRHH